MTITLTGDDPDRAKEVDNSGLLVDPMNDRKIALFLVMLAASSSGAADLGRTALIPAGTFAMGSSNEVMKDAHPWHTVTLSSFQIDRYPVTNEDFEVFVRATGYVTVAEKKPNASDYAGVPPENLVAGSSVFSPPSHPVPLNDHLEWWSYVKGASWKHPEGPTSGLIGREKHPVVHVAWEDAAAYCKWAGKRLPTEAEFGYAARGGLKKKYSWGNQFKPNGHWMANIWQGHFPDRNTADDGYRATSPVGTFPANGYGLYDVAGNVWEWCSDWYRADYYATLVAMKKSAVNPEGPPG